MNGDTLIAALDLPTGSRVDQRVPKKLLLENGAPTAADKRLINDGIEGLFWLAALKPTTIGVPEYRDEVREYLEIAVLTVTLRPKARAGRLAELVHRAVPYPVFLVTTWIGDHGLTISQAQKRWSQNEAGKVVLEDEIVELNMISSELSPEVKTTFLSSLPLARQPRQHLLALYQGWLDTLLAAQAAGFTGRFTRATTTEGFQGRREALRQVQALQGQIAGFRELAAKEKQMARQVELNLESRRCEAELAKILKQI